MIDRLVSLDAIQVVRPDQVETMRRIRNATAMGFSHDNTQISEQAQRAWWVANRGRIRAWLYAIPITEEIVGFGMLRQTGDSTWWNSLGVLSKYRGRKFGSSITADLLSQHDGTVYSSVRQDNYPAISMHHAEDWERTTGPDSTLVYFRSKPRD